MRTLYILYYVNLKSLIIHVANHVALFCSHDNTWYTW
jgi:hypothetical protein